MTKNLTADECNKEIAMWNKNLGRSGAKDSPAEQEARRQILILNQAKRYAILRERVIILGLGKLIKELENEE